MMCSPACLFLAGSILLIPVTVCAYVGPGAGITLLPALWGMIVTGLVVCGGVLVWPVRLLWRKFRKKRDAGRTDNDHR